MAERYRTATGNWSNAAQWDGGVSLPGASDDCYANGFTCTIDQNVTVASLRTTAGSVAASGGTFNATTQTINANVIAGTSTCLNITGMGVLNGNSTGGTSANSRGVTLAAGAVQYGNSQGGTSSSTMGTRVLTGSVQYGNSQAGTGGTCTLADGGTHIGDATGGTTSADTGTQAVNGGIFYGRCIGGSNATAYGVQCFSGGVAIVTQITNSTGAGCRLENGGTVILWGTATEAQVNNAASVGQYVIGRGGVSRFPFIRPPIHPSSAS